MKKKIIDRIISLKECESLLYSCRCCVKIKLNNVVWKMNSIQFKKFKQYIENIVIEQNNIKNGQVTYNIGLSNYCVHLSVKEETMDDFLNLLEKTEIRIFREKLSKLEI